MENNKNKTLQVSLDGKWVSEEIIESQKVNLGQLNPFRRDLQLGIYEHPIYDEKYSIGIYKQIDNGNSVSWIVIIEDSTKKQVALGRYKDYGDILDKISKYYNNAKINTKHEFGSAPERRVHFKNLHYLLNHGEIKINSKELLSEISDVCWNESRARFDHKNDTNRFLEAFIFAINTNNIKNENWFDKDIVEYQKRNVINRLNKYDSIWNPWVWSEPKKHEKYLLTITTHNGNLLMNILDVNGDQILEYVSNPEHCINIEKCLITISDIQKKYNNCDVIINITYDNYMLNQSFNLTVFNFDDINMEDFINSSIKNYQK